MIRRFRMFRVRAALTGLFLLLNKLCFGSTAQFVITPYYESYYGFDTTYNAQTQSVNDVIFYQINGGMRVMCNATLKQADQSEETLPVYWYEMVNGKYGPVSRSRSAGVWDPGNKTLLISAAASTPDLARREFACKTTEHGYDSFSSPQTMTLSYIDEFAASAERVLVPEQDTRVYIQCPKPAGEPEPVTFFSHNDTRIDTERDPRFNIISSGALQVVNISLEDSGDYFCTAANAHGAVVSPITRVDVEMSSNNLSIIEKPANLSSIAGETVTLTCRFNRRPQSFGWQYRTMANNAGSTSDRAKERSGKWVQLETGDLVITNLDRNDSGKYTCYGRDDDNNVWSTAYLVVNIFDTSLAAGPTDARAMVGDTTVVSCTLPDSYPPAEVAMFHQTELEGGATLIQEDDRYTLKRAEMLYELTITNVSFGDAGDYYCSAQNLVWVANSQPFDPWMSAWGVLAVRDNGMKPSQFYPRQHMAVSGNIGSTVTVQCSAIADPKPELLWWRGDASTGVYQPVHLNDTRLEFTSAVSENRWNYSIVMRDLTLEEHGIKYYCKLSNKMGSNVSPKTTVFVNHITCQEDKKRQEKVFNVQEPAQIACPQAISAHPKESIMWLYNSSLSSLRETGNSLYTDSLTAEDAGSYVCLGKNSVGNCTYTIDLDTQDPRAVTTGSNRTLVFIVAALAFIVLLVVMFVAILQLRKRAKKKKLESNEALERLNQPVFSATVNGYEDGPSALLPSPTSNMTHNQLYSTLSKFGAWQIAKSRLRNFSLLGEGQFGSVYKAELRSMDASPPIFVAIKQIKDDNNSDAIREYEKEMLMMTQLHHPNIVKLIGLCTDSAPFYILTEYMERGNLAEYLQDIAQSKSERLSLPEQIHICVQVASGLKYMADKEFVHRDVAARNCLVGRDQLVKVADFGLSRSVHGREIYQKDGGTVPIRWMAPEAIQYGHYTTAGDVWAYGVTIWEVFSYGVIPYSAWNNEDVAANVQAGSRLIRPDGCPQTIYNIMLHCWSELPDYRPSFVQIIDSLNAL